MLTLSVVILAVTTAVQCQRGSFAGTKPIGYPEIVKTTTTADPLGNRFGEADATTERLPLEANGDRDLVDRISKLPIDNQPFWYLNWKALEAQRKNPQTYPQRPSQFAERPNFNAVNTNSGTPNSNTGTLNSNTGTLNANTGTLNSNTGTLNANTGTLNANTGTLNSNTGTLNSNTGTLNSNTEVPNSNSGIVNSNTGSTTTNSNSGAQNVVPSLGNRHGAVNTPNNAKQVNSGYRPVYPHSHSHNRHGA